MANKNISNEQVINAWNSNLLGVDQETVEMLKILLKRYNLFIVSNTNSLHLSHIMTNYTDKHGENLLSYFKNTFFSFKIGQKKPSAHFFRHVINNIGCSPDACVFIDDIIENTNAVKKLGIHTIKHITNDSISYLQTALRNTD